MLDDILLSTHVSVYTGFLYFTKLRRLILTSNNIISCSDKTPVKLNEAGRKFIRGMVYNFDQIEGITISLIKDQKNFILHFTHLPSVEMFSEHRSDII